MPYRTGKPYPPIPLGVALLLCLLLFPLTGCMNGTETPNPPATGFHAEQNTIGTRFDPPDGYVRIPVEEGSFGAYLRDYPLKDYGERPRLYTGDVSKGSSLLGVLKQQDPLVPTQQCADTAIMLYAEYLFQNGRLDEISFQFLSGFECGFRRWADGYRVWLDGNDAVWEYRAGTGSVREGDTSYRNLLSYLQTVYDYANTTSMSHQYPAVDISDLRPGDFFVSTAKERKEQAAKVDPALAETIEYGHLILVADAAVNNEGKICFLLIEGTTPATECCVSENPDGVSGAWYFPDEDGSFVKDGTGIRWLPEWLRRFD